MRRLTPTAALLLAAGIVPTSTACYPPRIDSCRGPLGSFDGIGAVTIDDAILGGGFEQPAVVSFTVRAESAVEAGCIGVHSELWIDGTLDSVIDTPVTAHREDGELVTSPIFHYRPRSGAAMELRVTTLGRSLVIPVATWRDLLDAGPSRCEETGVGCDGGGGTDTSISSDASAGDAGAFDGGLDEDASVDDGGTEDGGTGDDASAGLDAG